MFDKDKQGFDINKAARILRAGDEFSKTNQKLREAAITFVEWLFAQVTQFQLPEGDTTIGWKLERRGDFIQLHFRPEDGGGWFTVSTDRSREQMNAVLTFCQTLAGPPGERLLSWLEQQTEERRRLLTAFETMLRDLRSALNSPAASTT